MSKEEFSREMLVEFKDNLSRLTGDGSLVKLDMANEKDLKARCNFLKGFERGPQYFTSAVFVYFCNVLDGMVDKKYKDRVDLITYVADHLVVAYMVNEDESLSKGLMAKRADELFDLCRHLDRKHYPSDENMAKIEKDFARIQKVWYQKYVVEKK